MKVNEIQIHKRDKEKIVAEIPIKTEVMIGTIRPKKGHTLFEINPFNGTCVPAVFKTTTSKLVSSHDINTGVQKGITHKTVSELVTKERHIYISALHKKSALKAFFKKVRTQVDYIKSKQHE